MSTSSPVLAYLVAFGSGLTLLLGGLIDPEPDPRPSPTDDHAASWLVVRSEGASPVALEPERVVVRAFRPEPTIRVLARHAGPDPVGLEVEVANVSRTFCRIEGPVVESRWLSPTRVRLTLDLPPEREAVIRFRDAFPDRPVRFLVGGDPELNLPVLERFLETARLAEPDFVWILGDVVQERGWLFETHDRLFESAEVPVYVAIGNHDLVDDRRNPPYEARKETFRRFFGPTDHSFVFRGVQFVALDTAAEHIPEDRLEWLAAVLDEEPSIPRRLILTHRPFLDPRPGRSHAIEDQHSIERLTAILEGRRDVVYYAAHVHDSYSVEDAVVPFRIEGSLSPYLEDDGERTHGYLDVTVGEGLDEERRSLESAGFVELAASWVVVLGPPLAASRPVAALGAALLLSIGLVGAIRGIRRRWRRRRAAGSVRQRDRQLATEPTP